MLLVIAILLVLVLIGIARCIVIVPQSTPMLPSGLACIRIPGVPACTCALPLWLSLIHI